MTAELVASDVPEAVVDDAAVVVSELVGNAVRHGSALPGGGLIARWQVCEGALRVEVVDGGSGPTGPRRQAVDDDEGGRGLDLVAALAERWGSAPDRPGTAVWAELLTVIRLP